MKLSQLFTKTLREAPADETSKNAILLARAGYIHKEMAGVYSLLPLGLKTFNRIVDVIRYNMNNIGALELEMTSLQDPNLWKKTNRYADNPDMDVWFTTKLKNETELGLGFTHEEAITNIMKNYMSSYKDMPVLAYQFQKKFRNETRAKSGIMRTREFVMKDLYSFAVDEKTQHELYEKCKDAYIKTFKDLGLGDKTYLTFASGGVFSKYSHEFQTICDAGEDEIYICDRLNMAINKEVYNDEVLNDLGVTKEELRVAKAAEVGNIFNLGTRFSQAIGLKYKNEHGESEDVWMGSYGIGPARVMGVLAEVYGDDKGLCWPEAVAPFSLHITTLAKSVDDESYKLSQELYNKLSSAHVDVLWDDRLDAGAGEKFADADLLGMPTRVTISPKSIEAGGVEIKHRQTGNTEIVKVNTFLASYLREC